MGELQSSFHEGRRITWVDASFPFTDARAARSWKDFGLGLSINETFLASVDYRRSFDESFFVADDAFSGSMGYAQAFSDGVSFEDEIQGVGEFRAVIPEVLQLSDTVSSRCLFLRDYIEDVRVKEFWSQAVSASMRESVRIRDVLLRPADIVLSDIALQDAPLDLAGFKALLDTVPGYETFMPYNVGEYEYKDALVRLRVDACAYGSEPVVYDAVINVDIEDTVDRGTVTITDTSQPTRVRFNKHYYTKPEVSVTLQGGNTSAGIIVPNIVAIDKDDKGFYFDVELIKSDKMRAKGRITWSAVGY